MFGVCREHGSSTIKIFAIAGPGLAVESHITIAFVKTSPGFLAIVIVLKSYFRLTRMQRLERESQVVIRNSLFFDYPRAHKSGGLVVITKAWTWIDSHA